MTDDSTKPPASRRKGATAPKAKENSAPSQQNFNKKSIKPQSQDSQATTPRAGGALAPETEERQKRGPIASDLDVVFVHERTADGAGYRVTRCRPQGIEVAEMRPPRDGQPLHGELVSLKPRPESSQLFDVEVVVDETERAGGRGRPAQVASSRYRLHWDQVFGATKHCGSAGKPN